MARKIDKFQFKRGPKSRLAILSPAEMAFTDDEKRLYVGDGNENIRLLDQKDKTEIDTKLTEKVSKVNGKNPDANGNVTIEVPQVDTSKLRLKTEKINQTDVTEEFLQQIAGTTPINAVPVNGGITNQKLARKSVGIENASFLQVGKNLFDKSKRTLDMVISELDGTLSTDLGTGYDVTDFIPVSAGVTYYINRARKYALYNLDKSFKTGFNNSTYANGVAVTPEVDGFIRYSMQKIHVDTNQMEVGSSGTTYEPFILTAPSLTPDGDKLKQRSIGSSIIKLGTLTEAEINPESKIVLKKPGKNLIDMSKVTPGYFVDFGTGNLVANTDNKATDFIAVEPNTTYTLSNQSPQVQTKDLSQLAFYNASKGYVSGTANSGTQQFATFTTGANVYFIRISIPTAITDGMMLEKGSVMSPYEPFGVAISRSDLPSELFNGSGKVITVKQNSGGDFSSLRAAIDSIKNASKNNPYVVEIHEGTYDIFGYYTAAELNSSSFDGLRIPDNVSIKGIGDKKKIILQGFLPDDEVNVTFESHGRISTVCPLGSGTIENLTITGKNLRYSVHDDYNYPGAKKIMKNCDIIRYKGNGRNYGGKQAWGEGSWSGQSYVFEDCLFFTEWDYYAYTSHNNTGFTEPSYHKFVNCKFFTTMGESSLRMESLNSGQKEPVELIGCKMNAAIDMTVHASNTVGIIDHDLKGYGNDIVPVRYSNTDGKTYTYEFAGESREMYNGSGATITKGSPVMLNSSGTSIIPFTGSGKIRFFGIAMQDIPTGTKGIVKTGGYLAIKDTPLTGLAVGDTVGVLNGVLTKVTTGDYIGIVILTGFIRLV